MVDINNYSLDGSIDYCVASIDSSSEMPIQSIDYLENIDQNDLINFIDCNDFNQNILLPETPPETPVNYNTCNSNALNGDNLNLSCSNLNSIDNSLFENSFVNSQSNISVSNINCSSQNSPTFIVSPQNTVEELNAATNCIQPSIVLNCQPILSNVDLNGFNLNGNNLLYSKNTDNLNLSKNTIQPKTILPNKVSSNNLTDVQKEVLKKQKLEARKVRNREAALNSRLKKKEYVDNLEENINKLVKENNELRLENKQLKSKISDLEYELKKLEGTDINGNYNSNTKKAKLSFFAIVFMVCFQVSPYLVSLSPHYSNNTSVSSKNLLPPINVNKHVGRNLLWKSDSDIPPAYYKLQNRAVDPTHFNSSLNSYPNATKSLLCEQFYNKTESIRLENELRDWLTRFKLEEKKLKSAQHQKLNTKKLLYDSKHVPIPRLKLWMQKQKYVDYLTDEFEHSLEKVSPVKFENLMSMIHRRDDTFYYLSYPSKGHLILPAISNRTDLRPRFSFLIPTFNNLSLDETIKHNTNRNDSSVISPQLLMLQIDCQVINTKVTLINDESGFENKKDKKKKMLSILKNRPKT